MLWSTLPNDKISSLVLSTSLSWRRKPALREKPYLPSGRLLWSSFSSAFLALVRHETSRSALPVGTAPDYKTAWLWFRVGSWMTLWLAAPALNCPVMSWDVRNWYIRFAFAVCVSNKLSKSIWVYFLLSSQIYGNLASHPSSYHHTAA